MNFTFFRRGIWGISLFLGVAFVAFDTRERVKYRHYPPPQNLTLSTVYEKAEYFTRNLLYLPRLRAGGGETGLIKNRA